MEKFLVIVHNIESGAVVNQFVTEAKKIEDAIASIAEIHVDPTTQDASAVSLGKVPAKGDK